MKKDNFYNKNCRRFSHANNVLFTQQDKTNMKIDVMLQYFYSNFGKNQIFEIQKHAIITYCLQCTDGFTCSRIHFV